MLSLNMQFIMFISIQNNHINDLRINVKTQTTVFSVLTLSITLSDQNGISKVVGILKMLQELKSERAFKNVGMQKCGDPKLVGIQIMWALKYFAFPKCVGIQICGDSNMLWVFKPCGYPVVWVLKIGCSNLRAPKNMLVFN